MSEVSKTKDRIEWLLERRSVVERELREYIEAASRREAELRDLDRMLTREGVTPPEPSQADKPYSLLKPTAAVRRFVEENPSGEFTAQEVGAALLARGVVSTPERLRTAVLSALGRLAPADGSGPLVRSKNAEGIWTYRVVRPRLIGPPDDLSIQENDGPQAQAVIPLTGPTRARTVARKGAKR